MTKHIFKSEKTDIGTRIDLYLSKQLTELSRSFVQKLIGNKKVKINNGFIETNYKLKLADDIKVTIPPPTSLKIIPEKYNLDIIYEDKEMLAVNKPANMVVHAGAGQKDGTLVNFLMYHCKNKLASDPVRPGIVHRLDKDTSGIILVAKTDQTRQFLMKQFADRKVAKTYIALVEGTIREKVGEISSPIARDPGDRKKMNIMHTAKARKAVTLFEVVKHFCFGEFKCSLLKVNILTGRTHQIRVHMRSIGHPVVGDTVYGQRKINQYFSKNLDLNRQFLHAKEITFTHPTEGKMTLSAPLPNDLQKLISDTSSL